MRFEFERDISAFKGTGWTRKCVLRRVAEERDPSIRQRRILIQYFIVPLIYGALGSASYWASQFFPHFRFLAQLLVMIAIAITIVTPTQAALYSLLVVPKIRKALEAL